VIRLLGGVEPFAPKMEDGKIHGPALALAMSAVR
jgi:hypothetical protein